MEAKAREHAARGLRSRSTASAAVYSVTSAARRPRPALWTACKKPRRRRDRRSLRSRADSRNPFADPGAGLEVAHDFAVVGLRGHAGLRCERREDRRMTVDRLASGHPDVVDPEDVVHRGGVLSPIVIQLPLGLAVGRAAGERLRVLLDVLLPLAILLRSCPGDRLPFPRSGADSDRHQEVR